MRLRCLFVLEEWLGRTDSQKEEQRLLSQIEEGMLVGVHRHTQVVIFVRVGQNFNDVQLDLQRKVEKAERMYGVLVVPLEPYIV